MGAGIGILSTELGYFLADLIYKDRGLRRAERDYTKFNYARKSSFSVSIRVSAGRTGISRPSAT